MRLYKYIKEKKSSVTVAFWISPDGEVIGSLESHIQQILQNAEKFGLKLQNLRDIFKKHNEPIGHEGEAREEIIERILTEGWMRIRKYPNQGYSITVAHARMINWELLIEWAQRMLNRGILGFNENDEQIPVYITDLLSYKEKMTLGELANYAEIDRSKLKVKKMMEQFTNRTVGSNFWTKNYINELKEQFGDSVENLFNVL